MKQNPHKLKEVQKKAELDKQRELDKIKELRQQFEEEKEIATQSDMSWMYKPNAVDKPKEQEDFLLGNKKYQPLDNVKEFAKIKTNHVPGALFISSQRQEDNTTLLNTIDSRNKMREDPLAFILSAQEKAARDKLKDPRNVDKIKKKIEKQKRKLEQIEEESIQKPKREKFEKSKEEKEAKLKEMMDRGKTLSNRSHSSEK